MTTKTETKVGTASIEIQVQVDDEMTEAKLNAAARKFSRALADGIPEDAAVDLDLVEQVVKAAFKSGAAYGAATLTATIKKDVKASLPEFAEMIKKMAEAGVMPSAETKEGADAVKH